MDILSAAVGAAGMLFLAMLIWFLNTFKKPKVMLGNLKQKVWEMDEKVRNINKESQEVHNELNSLWKIFKEMEK